MAHLVLKSVTLFAMILQGWKQIAEHLDCGYRTAQRWEEHGLPIKRVTKGPRSRVYADSEELDCWIKDGNLRRLNGNELLRALEQARDEKARLRKNRDM